MGLWELAVPCLGRPVLSLGPLAILPPFSGWGPPNSKGVPCSGFYTFSSIVCLALKLSVGTLVPGACPICGQQAYEHTHGPCVAISTATNCLHPAPTCVPAEVGWRFTRKASSNDVI